MSAEERSGLVALIDEAISAGARQSRACEVIGLCERRLRSWRSTSVDGRTGGYRATDQALTEEEKDRIVETMNAEELRELPLKQAFHTLMDRGVYLASFSTVRRVMLERGERSRKTGTRKRNAGKRPELVATAPNQVWCWDISWLESPTKGKYFFLYMIIDMFSRKVVGWSVAAQESGTLARKIFAYALAAEGIRANQLIVHADNGKPMRSHTLQSLFNLLAVTASHGRPHTSNDNAYAESLFATFKDRVSYPDYFRSLSAAREYCARFFTWYNSEHLHSGLDYLTPSQVHTGAWQEIIGQRNVLLDAHRQQHPQRYGGTKKRYALPELVRLTHRVTLPLPGSTPSSVKPGSSSTEQRMNGAGLRMAGAGCRQGPNQVQGLHALDGRQSRQYSCQTVHPVVEN